MTSPVQTRQRPSVTVLMVALLSACLAFQLDASMPSPALVSIQEELAVSAGAVLLAALAVSFLVPRPVAAEAGAERAAVVHG